MRKITKFAIMSLTILSANLFVNWVQQWLATYEKAHFSPLVEPLIMMAVVLLLLYPLMSHIDRLATVITTKILHVGKSFFGKKLGVFVAMFVGSVFLYFLYAFFWFHRSPVTIFRYFGL